MLTCIDPFNFCHAREKNGKKVDSAFALRPLYTWFLSNFACWLRKEDANSFVEPNQTHVAEVEDGDGVGHVGLEGFEAADDVELHGADGTKAPLRPPMLIQP